MSEMSPAEAVFFAALEKTPTERAAYLDEVCVGQPELRARVEKLLAAHPLVGAFLEDGEDVTKTYERARPVAVLPPIAVAGTVVAGKYKLLQQIGEGGMGAVWMADQTEPVKRRVAVKLIRAEKGSSKTILSRFEAERQAIALMDHPHIAKLLDAGTTDIGSPFFVMELVKGVPLHEFCDAHKLTIADRLQLFLQICSAVQHAHQKGIIHRDLKPTNVLVESHDGKPVPKVIDFGLAKATSGMQLSEQTLFTGFGSVMGTPLYMAPEQATFNAVDVDTRADVYALGVILYELLTGTTPLARESIQKAALDEMLKLIREQEAPSPSSRLSTSASLPSVAANRQMEPAKLGRFVKGELDWIVLKALAKERDRRYETANGFAKDIERYLNHEPVTAGPPSASYRLRKFVRRNRGPVVAAGLVALALLAGAAGTTWGMVRASDARDAEARERRRAERERDEKEAARQAAADAAAEARDTLRFFEDHVLAAARPKGEEGGLGKDVTLRAALDAAEPRVGPAFAQRPRVEAAIRAALGRTYYHLCDYSRAASQLHRAYDLRGGPDGLAECEPQGGIVDLLSISLFAANRPQEVARIEEPAYRAARARFGPGHPATAARLKMLAGVFGDTGREDEILPLLDEARSHMTSSQPITAEALHQLGQAYFNCHDFDRAIEVFELANEISLKTRGPDHPKRGHILNDLAVAYDRTGQRHKTVPLYAESIRIGAIQNACDSAEQLQSQCNYVIALTEVGRSKEALPIAEDCLKLCLTKFGEAHEVTQRSRYTLASAQFQCGDAVGASRTTETLLRVTRQHPDLEEAYESYAKIGDLFYKLGRHEDAIAAFEEALRSYESLGSISPNAGKLVCALCENDLKLGRAADALARAESWARRAEAARGPDHIVTLQGWRNVAWLSMQTGKYGRACAILSDVAVRARKLSPRDLELRTAILAILCLCRAELRQSAEAGAVLDELREIRAGLDQPGLNRFVVQLVMFGKQGLDLSAWFGAEPILRECLTIRTEIAPDDWTTFNTQSMLGAALLGQKRHADAEPLLLKGYEGMKTREKTIPKIGETRIPEALDRLVKLYEETNRPDEAAKWRAERAKYPEVAPNPRPVR